MLGVDDALALGDERAVERLKQQRRRLNSAARGCAPGSMPA
jgi:hypothetical protein